MGARQQRNITSMDNNFMKQRELQERRLAKRRKLLFRRLTVFFALAAVIVYTTVSALVSQASQLEAKQQEKAQAEEKLAEMKTRQLMLKDEIKKLNDDEYIAKLARSEYFLSKKGEIIFSIPEAEKSEDKEDGY